MKPEQVDGVVLSNEPGYPRTQFDDLPFPGGRNIPHVDGSEIARTLIRKGVAGISHENGREVNLAAYAQHLETIGNAAADQAVKAWLAAP